MNHLHHLGYSNRAVLEELHHKISASLPPESQGDLDRLISSVAELSYAAGKNQVW